MQPNRTSRLRATLLGTTAALVASLGGGGAVVLLPGAAFAANECGDPSANGAAADTLTCPPGAYPTGISETSNGDLTLILQESAAGAVVSSDAIVVTGGGADKLTISRASSGAGGDLTITSPTFALQAQSTDGAVVIDLTDPDVGDAPMSITVGTNGVVGLSTNGAVSIVLGPGAISAATFGVAGQSSTGAVSLSGAANITVTSPTAATTGAFAQTTAAAAPVTVNLTGAINVSGTKVANGVTVIAPLSAASVTTANVTVATSGSSAVGVNLQSGVSLTANNTGTINVTGTKSGLVEGIVANAIGVGAGTGAVSITSNQVTVSDTGAANTVLGILADTKGTAAVTSTKLTATGDGQTFGILVGQNNDVASATINSGTVTVKGGDGGAGIGASTSGDISVTSASVTTSGGAITGIGIGASTGKITIASGTVSATGKGAVGITAQGGGDVTITSGALNADSVGIDGRSTGGAVAIQVNGNVTSVTSLGVRGLIQNVANGANNTVTIGDGLTVAAANDTAVVAATAGAGNASIVVGKNDSFSAADSGLQASSALGDASVTTGSGLTIANVDADANGTTGTSAVSNRGSDAALGQASARISLGAGAKITADAGASGKGAVGLAVSNTAAGGSGSVAVNAADGLALTAVGGAGATGISASTNNDGAVSVTTGTGAIGVSGKAGAFNFGISAASFGNGAVTVTTAAAITAANAGGLGSVGLLAQAVGSGAVTVTTTGVINSTNGQGIVTSAGTGATTITTSGVITSSDDGVRTASGGGAYIVNANAAITAGANAVQASNTTGAGTINVTAGVIVRGLGTNTAAATIDVTSTTGATTINNAGTIRSTNATVAGAAGELAIHAAGGSVTVNNAGRIDGRMDFSGLTGASNATVNNTSATSWHTTGLTTFSTGNDTVNNTAPGLLATSGATQFDFGPDTGTAPRDVFNNSGLIVAGETAGASNFALSGLETFNNSGTIVFGSINGGATSDGETNDRVAMAATAGGTSFVGSGGSTLVMDVALGSATQLGCGVALSADCLSLAGGTVTGSTKLKIDTVGVGGFNPVGVVLVDAGTITAGSLSLDPTSAGYGTRGGVAVIDTGLWVYHLTPVGTGQMALTSAPDQEVFEFAELSTALRGVWQTATGTWFDRQADLRDSASHTNDNYGMWLRFTGDWRRRSSQGNYTDAATTPLTMTYNTSYNQDTWSLIGGVDLIYSGAWVFGVTGGYVHSQVDFSTSPTLATLSGGVLGVYGSWVNGDWFVDATLNTNLLTLNESIPTLAKTASGSARSVGGQVELGWRQEYWSNVFFEPLASVSYSKSSIGDLGLGTLGDVRIAGSGSARGSLGARVSGVVAMQTVTLKAAFTAKVVDDFSGTANALFTNPGAGFISTDRFTGPFGDFGGQLQFFNGGKWLSGFVNANYRVKGGYRDTSVSIGARYQW